MPTVWVAMGAVIQKGNPQRERTKAHAERRSAAFLPVPNIKSKWKEEAQPSYTHICLDQLALSMACLGYLDQSRKFLDSDTSHITR